VAESIEVRDGARRITFDGQLIGSVSSRRHDSPRWSEYKLYRTVAGSYVLEKVGRSIVVHMPSCQDIIAQLDRFQTVHPGADPTDGWWFCETCTAAGYNITALLVENDRSWVTISEDPQEIIDALYRRKGGARSLQRISLSLLEQASRADEKISEAFYAVEHLA
jgi:hypothetical protein